MWRRGIPALSARRRLLEEPLHVGHDVEVAIDGLAIMHDDDGGAGLGHGVRHGGILLKTPDIVDDRGAGLDRKACDARLRRIDRGRAIDRGEDLG